MEKRKLKRRNIIKIIALQWKENSGKTATLKLLIDLMKSKYSVIEQSNGRGFDCWAKFDVNGKTVAICTAGDLESIIEKSLNKIGKSDLFVCAVHTFGDTVKCLYRHADKQDVYLYGRIFYTNSGENLFDVQKEQKAVNDYQAKYLFDKIVAII